MDEITLFRELRPAPPDNAAQIREAARARLSEAMSRPAGHPGRERARARAGFWPAQHRSLWLAGVVTLAACAAIIVSLVLPSGRPPSGRPTVYPGGKAVTITTAAWTVHRAPNGTITVNVKQLRDPAGLQRTLRTEGVPAYVRYIPIVLGKPGSSVTSYPACSYDPPAPDLSPSAFNKIFSFGPAPPRSRARSRSSPIRRLSGPAPPSSSRRTRDRPAAAAPPPATPSP
jgi:hypothetical protein